LVSELGTLYSRFIFLECDLLLPSLFIIEKGELQRMCDKVFEQFENCKTSSIDHLQRLESFEKEKDVFIKKIKSLEDALMHSKPPLEKPCDYVMSNNNATSFSHAMPIHRTS